jgi:hypothetical protein
LSRIFFSLVAAGALIGACGGGKVESTSIGTMPLASLGESCVVNTNCAGALVCAGPAHGSCKTCIDPLPVGATCVPEQGTCGRNAFCYQTSQYTNGVCTEGPATLPIGSACVDPAEDPSAAPCTKDARCTGIPAQCVRIRTSFAADGDACTAPEDCLVGHYCSQFQTCASHRTRNSVALGGTCDDSTDCREGQCLARKCAPSGTVGEGGLCESDVCAGGLACTTRNCDGASPCRATCEKPRANGSSCDDDVDCTSGVCDQTKSVCVPVQPNGAECSNDTECVSGYCDGHCTSRVSSGAACDPTFFYACPLGEQCNPKSRTCTAPETLALGDVCGGAVSDGDNSFPCAAGSTCIDGACRTTVAFGGSCASAATTHCDDATRCVDGICKSAVAVVCH